MRWRGARGRRGFTLIEIMAVVLIIGLTLSLVLPNIAATRASSLEQRAREVAARIELARERAIVTATPHRVMLDLEEGIHRVDWYVTESRAAGMPEEPDAALGPDGLPVQPDYASGAPISLLPPENEQRDYYPIPSRFGQDEWLPEDYFFVGVQTPEGWLDRGSVQIVFERDGTSDYAEIVLGDAWEHRVVLEIQPLLDMVRIHPDDED